ncbi:AAA family ATPase [Flexibacterium corallicola]|uniref:AAA family ATPase n=1 Tax=Flexibacterium corallicola TaxID=3037259 RepID=UPI00286FA0D1|nr:AAA family ATPase [Pseudovibrio sp. M1P-2-3]
MTKVHTNGDQETVCYVWAIASIKGGVGKTTLACNLAAHLAKTHGGDKVLVMDADKQGTANDFTTIRYENPELPDAAKFDCIKVGKGDMRRQVRSNRKNYQHIVIDVGGQDNGPLRAALLEADKMVVPTPPRSFDLWALDGLSEMLLEAREVNEGLQTQAVINFGRDRGPDNQKSIDHIKETYPQFNIIDPVIVKREVWAEAAGHGLSVTEAKPYNPKASHEHNAFLSAILEGLS